MKYKQFPILILCMVLYSCFAYAIPFIREVSIRPDFTDHPFIEVNQTVNLTLSVYSSDNNNAIIDDLISSNVTTDGSIIAFLYSGLHYWNLLQYNTTGSKQFITLFTRTNTTIKNINVNFSIVKYVNLSVELYKDVNLSKHYSDNRAYIIAYPLFSHDYDFSMYRKLANNVNSISKFLGNQVEQSMGIDLSEFIGTQLYLYSEKVFEGELINGVATFEVPAGFKYNIDIFAPETTTNFLFVGNKYKEMYYKEQSYDLSIEKSLMITTDTLIQAVITQADTHPYWYWGSRIVLWLSILGIFLLPILIFSMNGELNSAIITGVVMVIVTFLIWVIELIINWVVF